MDCSHLCALYINRARYFFQPPKPISCPHMGRTASFGSTCSSEPPWEVRCFGRTQFTILEWWDRTKTKPKQQEQNRKSQYASEIKEDVGKQTVRCSVIISQLWVADGWMKQALTLFLLPHSRQKSPQVLPQSRGGTRGSYRVSTCPSSPCLVSEWASRFPDFILTVLSDVCSMTGRAPSAGVAPRQADVDMPSLSRCSPLPLCSLWCSPVLPSSPYL